MEDGMMYNIVDVCDVEKEYKPGDNGDDNNSIHSSGSLIDGEGDSGNLDRSAKVELVHKWWEAVYDIDVSTKL